MATITYVGVLVRAGRILTGGDGRPPTFSLPAARAPFWQDVAHLCSRFSGELGTPVTVLRPLAVERVSTGSVRIYALEAHGPIEGTWRDPATIETGIPGKEMTELLEPLGRPVSGPLDVPWYRPGWYENAVHWIEDWAAGAGIGIETIRQRRNWGVSTVIDVATPAGRFFFKAQGPPFPVETRKTAALAGRFPDLMPTPAKVDHDKGWMILGDAGARRLDASDDLDVWAEAIAAYARLQLDSTHLGDELAQAGFPSYDADDLQADIAAMVADREALSAGDYALTPGQIAALRRPASGWIESVGELATIGIPPTVEHGDFHPGQVILDDSDQPRILDWSDAAIANPLISLDAFLATLEDDYAESATSLTIPRIATACREAYLEVWQRAVPRARLEDGLELITGARPALRALPNWRMVQRMENRWEFENVVPWLLGSELGRSPS